MEGTRSLCLSLKTPPFLLEVTLLFEGCVEDFEDVPSSFLLRRFFPSPSFL